MTNDQVIPLGRRSLGFVRWTLVTLFAAVPLLSGCGGPNAANIALRKENQSLKDQVAKLELQHKADMASLAVAAGQEGTTRPALLDLSRLPDLFTVVDLEMGRLTSLNTDYNGKVGLKVQVAPRDDTGDKLKASGRFVIEATDPSQSPEPLLGRWEFGPQDLKHLWYSSMFVYSYVLQCPWDKVPTAERIRVKVHYTDLLTGRALEPVESIIKNTAKPQ